MRKPSKNRRSPVNEESCSTNYTRAYASWGCLLDRSTLGQMERSSRYKPRIYCKNFLAVFRRKIVWIILRITRVEIIWKFFFVFPQGIDETQGQNGHYVIRKRNVKFDTFIFRGCNCTRVLIILQQWNSSSLGLIEKTKVSSCKLWSSINSFKWIMILK